MDHRLQSYGSMTGLRLLAWLTTATITVGALSGCGDNMDELAAARAAKKPAPQKTAPQGEGVIPVSDTGATLPPIGGTDPTKPGGACQPQPVATLDVQWRPPHAPHMKVCTAQEASLLASCFFGNQGCDQTVSTVCHNCAVSSAASSSTYGAIIVDESGAREAEPNVEGCVAIATGDVSANGCGARLRSKFGCESQACSTCGANDSAQCVRAAGTGVCAAYSQAATSCMGSLAQCIKGTTPAAVALNLIQLFCM